MREIALASMLLAIAPSAIAQEIPDPAAEARIHLGPLAFSPTLSLVNAGVDTNVFYEPDQLTPKRDFTITFQPKTDWWLRIGRTWLVGTVTEALVYYNTYASERSVNGFYKLGWLVPMTRFTFRADGSYLTTRERPGFEGNREHINTLVADLAELQTTIEHKMWSEPTMTLPLPEISRMLAGHADQLAAWGEQMRFD